MNDYHTHTRFSQDSTELETKIIAAAARAKIMRLAITDHYDEPYPGMPGNRLDFAARFCALDKARRDVSGVEVLIGVECGFLAESARESAAIINAHPFEFVINSVHSVGRDDCYFSEFFDGRTKREAYGLYLRAVRDSLDAPFRYDLVGHLGYIVRNAPYPDKELRYEDFADLIDDILKTIIAKNRILEINGNIKTPLSPFVPNIEILTRYRDLGGLRVAFGSDAHTANRVGSGYREARLAAAGLGLTLE